MHPTRHLHLDPHKRIPLLRSQESASRANTATDLPITKTHTAPPSPSHPSSSSSSASVTFIGNATTLIQWRALRVLTDPNFLHAGDHVHLGPGVTARREINPFIQNLEELPPLDLVLLSHYHEDHFDREVEAKLSRGFPIVTTAHARGCLMDRRRYGGEGGEGPFREVYGLESFESVVLHIDDEEEEERMRGGGARGPVVKVTAMPGEHVRPGLLATANRLLGGAVPPTNGWLLELGWSVGSPGASSSSSRGKNDGGGDRVRTDSSSIESGYRIYISGDTLFVDELRQIPDYIRDHCNISSSDNNNGRSGDGSHIDLMIAHLGGTTIPGPRLPLLMVTMDAKQGVELMRLLNPGLTIPVHFDDYSVMLSSLEDFKTEVADMGDGWSDRVVYLERGEQFRFKV